MAFWNKSDDPWDRKPGEQRAPVYTEPEEQTEDTSLADKARAFFDIPKKEPEVLPDPIPCPWCGKPMAARYLTGGRDGIYLRTSRPKVMELFPDAEKLDTDGGMLNAYKFAWYCGGCRKLVMDIPEPEEEPYTPKQDGGSEMDRYLQG